MVGRTPWALSGVRRRRRADFDRRVDPGHEERLIGALRRRERRRPRGRPSDGGGGGRTAHCPSKVPRQIRRSQKRNAHGDEVFHARIAGSLDVQFLGAAGRGGGRGQRWAGCARRWREDSRCSGGDGQTTARAKLVRSLAALRDTYITFSRLHIVGRFLEGFTNPRRSRHSQARFRDRQFVYRTNARRKISGRAQAKRHRGAALPYIRDALTGNGALARGTA